jgi:hypothetical protein
MSLYISPQMSIFPSVLSKSCHEFYQPKKSNPVSLYQTQRAPQTAKIFKCISECTFCRTQLVAMHNTVMTRNTNGGYAQSVMARYKNGGYAQYRYDRKLKWWPT